MWRSFNSWWRHVNSSLHGNRNLEPQSGLKNCPLANQDGCPGVRRLEVVGVKNMILTTTQ